MQQFPFEDCTLLARQGLPFRAHRNEEIKKQDFSLYSQNVVSGSTNSGNFLETIKLCVANDQHLKHRLDVCPANKTFLSKHSQKKIIKLLSDQVSERITGEARKSEFFSIMIDEVTDTSTKEQMAVVVRYMAKGED